MTMPKITLAAAALLSACSMAPPLEMPQVPVAPQYKEIGPWAAAQPADQLPRGAWWTLYRDSKLDVLEQQLIANNPDLAAALANYAQAEAYASQLRSGLFPNVSANASADRNRDSLNRPLRGANTSNHYSDYVIGVQADYEVDLWGRVRNLVTSGKASAEAEQANLESTRLSLQAELAQQYITLRGLDREIALLQDTVAAYRKTLDLTIARHDGGLAPGLDVARARTQFESAQSQVAQAQARRALAEHAIGALVGASVSEFSIAANTEAIAQPTVPVGMPSELLQRRPDIAAAQRRIIAANADIGVAKSAYFPRLNLSGVLGYESAALGDLIAAPSLFWAVGPALALDLFDGGRRKAQVAQTQAALDQMGAQYRGVVIRAFQQVEDNLALLNHYGNALQSQRAATDAAKQSQNFATVRYEQGAASYLEVTASQTVYLDSQRELLDLDTRTLQASVQLIRALGGGWNDKAAENSSTKSAADLSPDPS